MSVATWMKARAGTVKTLTLLAGLALAPSASLAQDDAGPLRFLRPSTNDGVPAPEVVETQAEEPDAVEPPAEPGLPAAEPDAAPEGIPAALGDGAGKGAPALDGEPEEILTFPEATGSTQRSGPDLELENGIPPETDATGREQDGGRIEQTLPPGEGSSVAPGTAEAPDAPGVLPAPETAIAPPRPFRLGVLAGRDVRATMALLEPVTEGLAEALGRSVEVLPMASYGAMVDAQAAQRIDGGFYSATSFATADAYCRCLEALVAPASEDGTAAYYAIIVARPDSGIRSEGDLAGKVVAMAHAGSIGGRRMQLAALAAQGVNLAEVMGSMREVESAEEAVLLVADGTADAAFAWSSLAGDIDAGYSRGTLAALVRRDEIGMDEISVIWRSPAIGHGPVAVLRTLPEEDKRKVEVFLLDLASAHPAAYDVLNPFYGGGYVAVEPDDYSGARALAAADVDSMALPRPAAETEPPAPPE